ncbi:Uncharacterized protein ALO52_05165 [Pseudomonas syringae pv. primulae]|uniref:Uncharacterized protein n=1 Tax=Pseudomonas syringae pv. primulae TaxID=251707 RepID=A0A0P9YT74_9PSED|nr:Uncharacterized protein ALO52_05165 [Pseudomonas syringae pv. primulae]
MRPVPHALVGHQRSGLCQLQRRGLHVALADTENQGFAGEPGLTASGSLPVTGRHQAWGFFEHVQGDFLADAELVHVRGKPIDAQLVSQVVKIGVVGAHDRGVQIDPAVTGTVPVTVFVVVIGQLIETRIEHPRSWCHDTCIKTGNGDRRLDGRTRWIEPAQDPVEQRPVDGIAQLGVGLEADAGHEQVRVEAGCADHRQHFTGFRVQRHNGATTPAQRSLGRFLQIDVQAQDNVLAGNRIGTLEHPQHAAAGVGFDFLVTDLTMKLGLVETLDAGLADMVGAAVIDRIEAFELFLVDAAHVADRMREMRPLRIMPDQLRHDLDARQAELIDRNQGNLLFRQLEQNGNGLKRTPPLLHAFFENDPVVRRELQYLDDGVQHCGPVAGTLTRNRKTETGPVVRHHDAVAVIDQAPAGRNRLNVNPIVFRKRRVVVVLNDLQKIQSGDQHAHQQHDRHSTEHDPAAHQACVFLMVFEADRLRHLGRIHSKNDATCDKGARTELSRRDTSAHRSGYAPADAARSAATATSVARCAHRLPAQAPRDRPPSD